MAKGVVGFLVSFQKLLEDNLVKYIFILIIRKYITISPKKFRGKCVFTPSCSLYSLECFKRFGTFGGICLTLSRLGRCVPRNGGDDPVPDTIRFYPNWMKYI